MLYILALLAVLLVVAACGKADDSKSAPEQKPPAPQTSVGSKSDLSAQSLFRDLFAKARVQWKIAYEVAGTVKGTTTTYQMTQYIKGAEKVRVDATVQGMETRTYMLGRELTTCYKTGTSWSCSKVQQQDELRKTEDALQSDPSKFDIVADGTKTVAGVNAACYKVTGRNDSTMMRYCFAPEGAPLYVRMEATGILTEMTATSYSKTVSDGDFALPASAQDAAAGTVLTGTDACAACNYLSGSQKELCLQDCART